MKASSNIIKNSILRITLVNPPFKYFPGMKILINSYTRPPLGIAYLASYLQISFPEKIKLKLIDCEAEKFCNYNQVIKAILKNHPHIVGFSVVTGTFKVVSELSRVLKKIDPNIRIIAGGPHITALPEEYIPGVDVKIFGEGEITLFEYITEIFLGGSTADIKGCIQFKDKKIVSHGGPRPLIKNLDLIPIPVRELLPTRSYFHSYPYPKVRNFTTMLTSRGCPYNCNFCGNEKIWGKKVRFHSLERIFEEIDLIIYQGINLIFFDDDTFTVNKSRVSKICKHIRRFHPHLRWICHARADTIDLEILTEMKKSGCVEIQVGVESGDPYVLEKTDKSLSIEEIRKAFALLNKVKLNTWATFILGNSGETPTTIRKSIKLAKEINPTYCSFIVLLPFPGTRIFEKYKKRGYITTFDWNRYSWHGRPIISTKALTDKDLIAWRKRANLEFYLRPPKLLETSFNMIQAFSFREIMRNFLAWWTLVSYK